MLGWSSHRLDVRVPHCPNLFMGCRLKSDTDDTFDNLIGATFEGRDHEAVTSIREVSNEDPGATEVRLKGETKHKRGALKRRDMASCRL